MLWRTFGCPSGFSLSSATYVTGRNSRSAVDVVVVALVTVPSENYCFANRCPTAGPQLPYLSLWGAKGLVNWNSGRVRLVGGKHKFFMTKLNFKNNLCVVRRLVEQIMTVTYLMEGDKDIRVSW